MVSTRERGKKQEKKEEAANIKVISYCGLMKKTTSSKVISFGTKYLFIHKQKFENICTREQYRRRKLKIST